MPATFVDVELYYAAFSFRGWEARRPLGVRALPDPVRIPQPRMARHRAALL